MKFEDLKYMLCMLNSLRDHISYDTNITNYQMKIVKWLKSKVG